MLFDLSAAETVAAEKDNIANYQARRSTTSSATSEIAFEPRASTAP